MRSPVLAFSVLAATVGPSLISAAPAGTPGVDMVNGAASHFVRAVPAAPAIPAAPGLPVSVPTLPVPGAPTSTEPGAHQPNKPKGGPAKRATDAGTAGGNAYTGGTTDASGGNVSNISNDPDTTVSNTNSSKYILRLIHAGLL